jgi:hypothetical protein
MIRKTVHKHDLDNFSEIRQNLEYWLSRPPEESLAAVDALRLQYYGDPQQHQRVARVILHKHHEVSLPGESSGQQAQS